MADENKIFYKIEVHGEQGVATIRNMKGEFVKTKVPVQDLNKVMSDMNGTMSITSSEAGRQMARLKKLRSDVQINSKEYQNLTRSMMGYQKVLDGTGRATGASASAAMELGRVVSDMPYGIRGVANNLSQFASQMAFAAKSTGSLKLAIKDLFTALTGPLGVLLAIQAVIAAFDHFSQKKKEAKTASEEHNKALKEEISTLKGFVDILSNVNSTTSDRNRVIIAAIASNKDYAKSLNESSSTLLAQEEALRDLLEQKQKQLELDQKLIKLNELNNSGLQNENRSIDDLKERLLELKEIRKKELEDVGANRARAIIMSYQKELTYLDDTISKLEQRKKILEEIENLFEPPRQVVERSVEWYKQQISFAEKTRDQLSTTSRAYADQTKVIEGLRKELEKITGGDGKRKKVNYLDFKSLEEGRGKIIAEIMKTDEKIALLSAKDKKSRLIIQRDFHLRRLMAVDGANSELIAKYKEYYAKLIGIEEQAELGGVSIVDKKPTSIGATPNQIREAHSQRMIALMETSLEYSNTVVSLLTSNTEREITIEQNKTNALNNELRERLNNENLSASERKRIQLEISKNDEAMRVKKEKLEKKAFKIQKAANIAGALVSTYSGASAAYFNTLKNPINKIDPAAGLLRAKINAGIATAVGLANVAMIARQKFQSSISSAPSAGALGGGGSGGGNDRSFNFNLAGASRENQLAQTLQGRFDQPLQAYVVSRDITNQQQLDEEITSSASFG
jgi:hypothetical protein